MPKKSNKTEHVLNLLTGGVEPENKISTSSKKSPSEGGAGSKPVSKESPAKKAPRSSTGKVIVEVAGDRSLISDMVKADLEKELELLAEKKNKLTYADHIIIEELNSARSKSVESEASDSDPNDVQLEEFTSTPYVLENFNEEEDIDMETENKAIETKELTPVAEPGSERVLHNIAEDVTKSKAPEIMEELNMCTCPDCVYDVVALTLNHSQPLYTVTRKGELFQKLTSYETQYGADLVREITKACMQVKLHPRHPGK